MRGFIGVTVLSLLLGASGAVAQTVTLDEGTFRVLVGGIEVGTETFTIRQNGSGLDATIIANGRTVTNGEGGTRALNASLEIAGASLRPAGYVIRVEGGDQIKGTFLGRRVTAITVSSTAERVREYLVSEGAIVVDETVAHQHYFLARRVPDGGTRVPLVTPSENRQSFVEVTVEADSPTTIGGERVRAFRYHVIPAQGDERFFWADESGRVLRLEIPTRDLIVERTALPG